MRMSEDVILKPYITEKSNIEAAEGKYTFVVAYDATKIEIKMAVESLFDVKVMSVNTMKYIGKMKRVRQIKGPRPRWKKAVVKINTDPKPETYLAKGGKTVTSNKKYKTAIEDFGYVQ